MFFRTFLSAKKPLWSYRTFEFTTITADSPGNAGYLSYWPPLFIHQPYMNKDYKLWIPPSPLNTKNRKEWTSKDAKEYFNWFLVEKDNRVDYLLNYFDFSMSYDDILVSELGNKIEDKLLNSAVFSIESKELNNAGYSLAHDMALLLSKLLLHFRTGLKWAIVKRPKTDVNYNLPAIFGEHSERLYIDFIRPSI